MALVYSKENKFDVFAKPGQVDTFTLAFATALDSVLHIKIGHDCFVSVLAALPLFSFRHSGYPALLGAAASAIGAHREQRCCFYVWMSHVAEWTPLLHRADGVSSGALDRGLLR